MKHDHIRIFIARLFLTTAALTMVACGSSDVVKDLTAEERFESGKKKFDDEDYLDAISEFQIVKIQYAGSALADDAQYYLAESHFKREEFLLASEEYRILIRNYRASEYAPMAQYKIGLSYYNLSPPSALDQQYSKRAIDEFQTFIEYYPTHEFVPDGEAKIRELNERLARKLFDTAELYVKLQYYKAATIYYEIIVEQYHDTRYAESALLGKIGTLITRKKYEDAEKEVRKFLDRYPNSMRRRDAESLMETIEKNLGERQSLLYPDDRRP